MLCVKHLLSPVAGDKPAQICANLKLFSSAQRCFVKMYETFEMFGIIG